MMPALRNERHEAFAKALAGGKSAAEAYRSAGYQCAPHKARGHGHRLRTREDIAARIDELSAEARGQLAEPEPAVKRPLKRKRPTLPKFQQKRAAGRPPIYEPAYCPRAHKLALLGLTDVEIAEQFGISPDTLYEWQAAHPGFSEALQSGKTPADAEMAASFYKRGLGYEQPAVKIFMPAGADAPVYAPYMEHYPGDVGAQKSWLFNRQRDRWKDRQQVDTSGTLEVRLAQMTPDERAADAVALVQRIQARLAAVRTVEYEADGDPGVSDAEEE
jgi:hypothetical protein